MKNPYTLPDGNVQIAFSGGRTSAFMLHHILEANGGLPDRCKVIFTNTGREMPQTLDFVQECGYRWGVIITWLEYCPVSPFYQITGRQGAAENGEPFEGLIRHGVRPYLPNQASRHCTEELKIRPVRRYLVDKGWRSWTCITGIRRDEPSRHKEGKQKGTRWSIWQPLYHAGVSKHDVALFWRGQNFDLKLPNVNGNTQLGNCDGCFQKSEASLAALARDFPERHAWWERMEDTMMGRARKPSLAQFDERQSRRQLRNFIERQGDWIFDTEDGFCQTNKGECNAF